MSPFRGYFFQVSETYDGGYDLGESINYGRKLKTFLTDDEKMDNVIFKSLASTCLIEFSRIWGYHHDNEKLSIDVKLNTLYGKEDPFGDFIQASIDWVKKQR